MGSKPVAIGEVLYQKFTHGVAGKRVDEYDAFRRLETGQVSLAVGNHLIIGQRAMSWISWSAMAT